MNIFAMLGYKLFKEKEDESFDVLRITRIYNEEKVRVTDENGEHRKVLLKDLKEDGYTLLEPIGVITFTAVRVTTNDDVIVTLARHKDIKRGLTVPYVICRQSVTDFFYSILATEYDHGQVGVSVSNKTCPTNISFSKLLQCSEVKYSNMVNMYYDDTVDTILECVNVVKFEDILRKLYDAHVVSTGDPKLKLKQYDKGWCTTLKMLLLTNNFWIDVDAAFDITDVDFNIKNNLIIKTDEAGKEYYSFDATLLRFFCKTFELNMVDCIVTEYDYDIDLDEYQNENYVLLRDSEEKIYIMVYLVDGAYLEQDLAVVAEKQNLAGQYRLKIYDKYKNGQNK